MLYFFKRGPHDEATNGDNANAVSGLNHLFNFIDISFFVVEIQNVLVYTFNAANPAINLSYTQIYEIIAKNHKA